MTVALNVRVEAELKERLQERADSLGVSLSAVVQDVLWRDVFGNRSAVHHEVRLPSVAPSVVAVDALLEEVVRSEPIETNRTRRVLGPQGWHDA